MRYCGRIANVSLRRERVVSKGARAPVKVQDRKIRRGSSRQLFVGANEVEGKTGKEILGLIILGAGREQPACGRRLRVMCVMRRGCGEIHRIGAAGNSGKSARDEWVPGFRAGNKSVE